MLTSIIGYPRVGALRELKKASEQYFQGKISAEVLYQTAAAIRTANWTRQRELGISLIPSNDFSYYDGLLDTAVLFNIIPRRYRQLRLDPLDTVFAMARGYQGERGDVKALSMQKWFNTNYHFMVPELDDDTDIRLTGTKLFDEVLEARQLGVETKPVLTGPYTLLKLAKYTGAKQASDYAQDLADAYADVLKRLDGLGTAWVQLDEPALVTDLTPEDVSFLQQLYARILPSKGRVKVLLQTYFGDVRDGYQALLELPFDGLGLDFVEGKRSLELIRTYGWEQEKVLFAGVVNGRNVWRNRYEKTLALLDVLQQSVKSVVISTSCSLLHVPYTVRHESKLDPVLRQHLAFAEEKLQELTELAAIRCEGDAPQTAALLANNRALFEHARYPVNEAVRARVAAITEQDAIRQPAFSEREALQRARFGLPPLPTTTIGSFPQTAEVRANRHAFKKGTITEEQYKQFNFDRIAACITRQEELGLDVLVHGEYERNDMVEYFGECLEGFIFTENGWVQSYGTRCVKPPIVWGDISRSKPITVEYASFARSVTKKPVKGMLTGPVTILNWSFPREDVPLQETAYQIALAIRDEVLDLEANQIDIIQIDEAALREKLPLRRSEWQSEYLSWAIRAFRLVHSGVKPETQIHTHMCYSQFSDILKEIDAMDADVITFEASRSDLAIIEELHRVDFQTQVGPGVYDIHSPRIPAVEELVTAIHRLLERIDARKLWINPDCGLKTRGEPETWESLKHLVQAVKQVRITI